MYFKTINICIYIFILILLYYYFFKQSKLLSSKEYFSSSNNKNTIFTKYEKNIIDYNLILTLYNGEYHKFSKNKYTLLDNNCKIIKPLNNLNNSWKIPNLKISGGFYNYKNNTINFIIENYIYIYNLTNNKLIKSIKFSLFFKNKIKHDIDTVYFYINDNIYIINNNICYIFNLKSNSLIKKKVTDVFSDIPKKSKIKNCFINYNCIFSKNPLCGIYVIYDKKYNIYEYENNKFTIYKKALDLSNYNFYKNTIQFHLKYQMPKLANFNFQYTGNYRIYLVGAGHENGGFGGCVINDLYFKNGEKIDIILGETGNRIPLKDELIDNSESYDIINKLEKNGSCAGCGASLIIFDNKILMIAGGGGGWSSEIVISPQRANSKYYNISRGKTREMKETYNDNSFVFPLKKIVIKSANYKKKLNIKINNKISSLYKKIYNNENTIIEFDTILSDYNIILDDYYNLNIYDDSDNKYEIYEKKLNSDTIIKILSDKNLIKNQTNPSFNGKDINLIEKLGFIDTISNDKNDKNNINLKGGFGGGGNSLVNKFTKIINCGGGGGYKGGKGFFYEKDYLRNKLKYPYEFVYGFGGSSYIENINIETKELLQDFYNNEYNNKNGYIIMYFIN